MRRALIRNSDAPFSVRIHRAVYRITLREPYSCDRGAIVARAMQMLNPSAVSSDALFIAPSSVGMCAHVPARRRFQVGNCRCGVFSTVESTPSIQIALLAITITTNLTAICLTVPETKSRFSMQFVPNRCDHCESGYSILKHVMIPPSRADRFSGRINLLLLIDRRYVVNQRTRNANRRATQM